MAKKVLVVDDEKLIVKGIRFSLEQDGMEVDCAYDGEEAYEKAKANAYDMILLDIMLPKMNGFEVCQQIREFSSVPIVMLTAKGDDMDKILGLEYGADDYITKPYSPTILLLRIQNIFKRLDNSTEVLKYKDLEVSPSRGTLSGNNKELELTKNEMLIFQHLLNNQNRIVSRDELMTILWNNEEYINDNALTVNISRLRSKLEDFGYPNAIETRKGQGYILL